jgi:hypothetical protein
MTTIDELDEQILKKYADMVSPEHKAAMQAISLFYAMIGQHRETMQSLITLYRDVLYSKSLKQQLRLVKAAIAFLDEIDAVKAEILK